MSSVYNISNEKEAWEIYLKSINSEIEDNIELNLNGWPYLSLKLEGDKFHSSLPSRFFPIFKDLQQNIYKVYALAAYGEAKVKRLSAHERKQLEINLVISNGSTNAWLEIAKQFKDTISAAVGKMNGKQIVQIILGLALLYASVDIIKYWVHENAKMHGDDLSHVKDSFILENQRLLIEALKENHQTRSLVEADNDFKNSLIRATRPGEKITIGNELSITGEQAQKITHKPQKKYKDIRMDGEYLIKGVHEYTDHIFKIKALYLKEKREILLLASSQDMPSDSIDRLKLSIGKKEPVLLSINARVSKEEIITASILNVK